MSKRLVVAGRFGYRCLITDEEYAEVDWGSSADDTVRFEIEGDSEDKTSIFVSYTSVGSLHFGSPTSPSIGTHEAWRINARGPFGGADCLVDEENKDVLVAALASPTGIVTFNTIYGIEIRLVMENMARIEISPESVSISEP